ncbi:hypothetical protein GB880_007985 [Paracoccus sp. SMMA_5_TC]|uniref:DUF6691 family protein n=1 Tax=Paracoccus sp. SMMA_5_TC TaxID=2654280 RepID=UPI0012B1C952|nr:MULTISPECIES: DUF6691 family protein [unclassified Paracoccus (in: a-proteobacteria)]UXU73872.1 hypothetical protein GB879_008005 [Paracoccus sp. SMMA_5]UXU79760.1 hypothetical protein GB880_007985 [Paracoccus sp. SMMA_5_TC]
MRLIAGCVIGLVFGRAAPILAEAFQVPARSSVDLRLLGGLAVFGIGWGIARSCPGGVLPALWTGRWAAFAFITVVIATILLVKFLQSIGGAARRATA